jgi:hypothetical protein
MAFKEQVVELVLRARNLLSKGTDAASASIESLTGNAEGLQEKLRTLEDQKTLISQFERAAKSVDRTGAAYDRAEVRLEKLKSKLDGTGPLTKAQATEFAAAQRAVDRASEAYDDARGSLDTLAKEADKAGVDIVDLAGAQRENAKQTTAAKRALADLSKETGGTGSKVKQLTASLKSGALSFAKWGAAGAAALATFSAAAIARITVNQADLARQTLASARAFGLSTTALQEWQAASKQVGIEGDKTADILKDVAEKIGDAYATGGGEAADVIERLNLNIEELVRLSPDQQILKIAEQLDGMPKAEQIQVLEALASDASLLLPLLDNGAKKLRELAKAAQERGVIFSEEELQQLADADAAFERLKGRIKGLFNDITIRLAPVFEKFSTALDDALADKPELVDQLAARFDGLISKTTEWLTSTLANSGEVTRRFQTIGDVLEGVGSLFTAVFRGVQAFGAGAAEVAARFVYDWNRAKLAILEVREAIGLASAEAVESARFAVDNAATSVMDLKAQAEDYQQKMIEAGKAAAEAFTRTRDGADETTRSTKEATKATEELAQANEKVTKSAETAKKETQTLAQTQTELRKEVSRLATEIKRAQDEFARDASSENQTRVRELAKEYDRVVTKLNDVNEVSGKANENIKTSADVLKGAGQETANLTEETKKTYKQVVVLGEESQKTGEKMKQAAQTGGGAFAIATDVIQGYLNKMQELGTAVKNRFIELASGQKVAAQDALTLEERIDSLNGKITDLRQNKLKSGDPTGLRRMFRDLGVAAANAEKQYVSQLKTVRDLEQGLASGAISMRDYTIRAQAAIRQSDLLNEQDLSGLRAGIQQAQAQMESFRNSTADTLGTLQDELDRLRGNTEAIEQRRYQERIRELEAQVQTAEAVGDEESIRNAQKALDLARQIKAEKDREVQQAQAERAARERERQKELQQQQVTSQRRTPVSRPSSPGSTGGTMTLNLQVGGQPLGSLNNVDESEVRQLMDALERLGLNLAG